MDKKELQKKVKEKELELRSKVEQHNNYIKFLQEAKNDVLTLNGELKALKELERELEKEEKSSKK